MLNTLVERITTKQAWVTRLLQSIPIFQGPWSNFKIEGGGGGGLNIAVPIFIIELTFIFIFIEPE